MPTARVVTHKTSRPSHAPPPTFFLDALTFLFALECPETTQEEFLAISRHVGKLRYTKHIDRDANGITRIRSVQSLKNHRSFSEPVTASTLFDGQEPSLLLCVNMALRALLTFFYTHFDIGMASEVENGIQALRWYLSDCLALGPSHTARILPMLSQWVQGVSIPPFLGTSDIAAQSPNYLMHVGQHYATFWEKTIRSADYTVRLEKPLAGFLFKHGRIGPVEMSRRGMFE
jgi:hypothetical protein